MHLLEHQWPGVARAGFLIACTEDPPEDLADDLADVAKRVREAMDQIAWDAWLRSGGSPEAKVYFPIRDDAGALAKAKEMRHYPPVVRQMVIDVHSFDSEPCLPLLRDLVNASKHTSPNLTAVPLARLSTTWPSGPSGLAPILAWVPFAHIEAGVASPLAWFAWADEGHLPDDASVPVDDPRFGGIAPQFPPIEVKIEVSLACGDHVIQMSALLNALVRAETLMDRYEAVLQQLAGSGGEPQTGWR